VLALRGGGEDAEGRDEGGGADERTEAERGAKADAVGDQAGERVAQADAGDGRDRQQGHR